MALLVGGVGADSGGCGGSDGASDAKKRASKRRRGRLHGHGRGRRRRARWRRSRGQARSRVRRDGRRAPQRLRVVRGARSGERGRSLRLGRRFELDGLARARARAAPARARSQGRVAPDLRVLELLPYRVSGARERRPVDRAELANAAMSGDYDLQIGIRALEALVPRRPMNLTFVVDTSGSMSGSSLERREPPSSPSARRSPRATS